MKVLRIGDFDYYCYPEGISNLEVFIAYANAHYHSFVKMRKLETNNCVAPYFIREDMKELYVNIAQMREVTELDNAVILERTEYEARLAQIVNTKCIHCKHYTEELEGDNLSGHREKLTLDGECWMYHKKG